MLVLSPMHEHGGGAVISVASVAGLGTTSHDAPEYAVAKGRGGEPRRLLPLVDWQAA